MIERISHLVSHPMRGHVFENFVVSEFRKLFFHNGLRSSLYFWRDSNGLEIDLLAEDGGELLPIEIKSTATWRSDLSASIKKWLHLADKPNGTGLVVYDGDDVQQGTSNIKTAPWWRLL